MQTSQDFPSLSSFVLICWAGASFIGLWTSACFCVAVKDGTLGVGPNFGMEPLGVRWVLDASAVLHSDSLKSIVFLYAN